MRSTPRACLPRCAGWLVRGSTELTVSTSGPQGFVKRLLQAHGGRQGERRPPAGGGYREEQKRRDNLCSGLAPDSRMECEDSIPMKRRSTLPVNEILAAER